MGAKSALEASWGLLGDSWGPLGGLLELLKRLGRQRGGFQGLLDASWGALGAKKSNLERLLAAPRGIPRQVSAILGPDREAKRVQETT